MPLAAIVAYMFVSLVIGVAGGIFIGGQLPEPPTPIRQKGTLPQHRKKSDFENMDKGLPPGAIKGREYFEITLRRLGGSLVIKTPNYSGPLTEPELRWGLERAMKNLMEDFLHVERRKPNSDDARLR